MYYCSHSVEVSGSLRSLQNLFQCSERISLCGFFCIDFLCRRSKNHITINLFKHLYISVKIPRILFKVFFVVELNRIDKHTTYQNVIFFFCTLCKAQMSLVQSSHCRKQTYCFVLLFELLHTREQLVNFSTNLHNNIVLLLFFFLIFVLGRTIHLFVRSKLLIFLKVSVFFLEKSVFHSLDFDRQIQQKTDESYNYAEQNRI